MAGCSSWGHKELGMTERLSTVDRKLRPQRYWLIISIRVHETSIKSPHDSGSLLYARNKWKGTAVDFHYVLQFSVKLPQIVS